MPWDCPNCGRRFRRSGQSHECAPAMSLDEYFSTGPPWERPVFEAVLEHLESIGPVVVEPVSVGIFLKRAQTFAQLRPMTKWVALSFSLPHRVAHPLMTRKPIEYSGKYFHVINLREPDDLDDQVRNWLTHAYLDAPSE